MGRGGVVLGEIDQVGGFLGVGIRWLFEWGNMIFVCNGLLFRADREERFRAFWNAISLSWLLTREDGGNGEDLFGLLLWC